MWTVWWRRQASKQVSERQNERNSYEGWEMQGQWWAISTEDQSMGFIGSSIWSANSSYDLYPGLTVLPGTLLKALLLKYVNPNNFVVYILYMLHIICILHKMNTRIFRLAILLLLVLLIFENFIHEHYIYIINPSISQLLYPPPKLLNSHLFYKYYIYGNILY